MARAVYISEMTVDDVGNPEPVSPDVECATLTIIEKAQAATTNYLIYNSTDTTGVGAYNEIPAGLPCTLPAGVSSNSRLPVGEILARVATATGGGSKTFTKIHGF